MPIKDRGSRLVEHLIQSGDLSINDGYRAKNAELSSSGLPFARAGNINNGFHFEGADCFPLEDLGKVGLKISQPGDVVFTSKGTVGRFAYVRERTPRFVYAPQLCFWRSLNHDLIAPKWLYYWMHGREFFLQYKGVSGQTDMAEYVSLRDQRKMRITIPPLAEQKAIAKILGALDDKIELNRRMNETLESMARAIFKSWFVDFDPVRAKMDGRQPTGMDADTASLFPDSLEHQNSDLVPTGWSIAKLGDLAKNVSKTYDFDSTPDVVFINTGDVLNGDFLHCNRSVKGDLPGQAKKTIQPNDILFTEIRPGNRRFAFIDFDASDYVVSTKFMVVRSLGEIHPRLLYRNITSEDALREFQMIAESRSGTFPQITFDAVRHFPIVLPSEKVQIAFQSAVKPMEGRIESNKREFSILANLRDTLLPKLLSGELRVGDAAKQVCDAISQTGQKLAEAKT